ncbi:MAG: hydrolase 1, exosortase A system-associated [Azoarcus sp.]|jgi:exosortase A-associated hydrolase 1|nr:hydrolase 1, exosortase A system-associated [Azoarcus sp.]
MTGVLKMDYDERAFLFDCDGDSLPGIVTCPRADAASDAIVRLGVLIVGASSQYRAGAHRHFVLLARALAAGGVPCMRFDRRGMGDATGAPRAFDAMQADIGAALDAFFVEAPTLTGVMLWGLCDGASASVFYAGGDPRVDGLLLLNPWVHTETGAARVFLRHYYLRRLFSRAFWGKFLVGGVAPARALRDLWAEIHRARGGRMRGKTALPGDEGTLPERMCFFLQAISVPWWVILSGQDHVAREFDRIAASPGWAGLFPARAPYRLPDADHTFSSATWRNEVVDKTLSCAQAVTDVMKMLEFS